MTHRNWFVRPFVVIVALAVFSLQVAAQSLDNAIDLHDSGEFAAAIDEFLVLATSGEVAAQYYLGRMYHNGDGVVRDVGMAVRWYRLAAEGGHYQARLLLGQMFKTGEDVPQDGNEAAKWYGLAAEQGQAEAEKWINFAIEPGVVESLPLPGIELGLTRTTPAERETELGQTQARLQDAHGREEELAQALASERSELERLALLLQQSREAEERTGETLATTEVELQDAGERIDQLIASLSSVRDRTRELEDELSTEEERTLLAQMEVADSNRQLDELTRRLGIVEGERDLAEELSGSQVQQIADLRDRLASLNSALEAAEIKAAEDLVQITSLGERLNAALATRVQDLSRYRSDFLARLHDHLGNRQGVRVEGDRFVIQSGVLFPSGSAEISEEGRENLRQIADFIRELVSEIPDDVDWILRVDGHTDSKPIQTIRFPSNWELSTARATSVVRFMISLGVPEHRLMAAGLGEFQPLADGEDADTMQRNRRIEFKLTER